MFENVLRGMDIIVYTNHLKLLYPKNASQQMVPWGLIVEKFEPKDVRHIAASKDTSFWNGITRY